MSYSQTTITTRGYDVTIPTAAVAGFLALSHDDQVELADVLNSLDDDGELVAVEAAMDNDMDAIVESMAAELDVQDQAIAAFVTERAEKAVVRADQSFILNVQDQAIDAFMGEREALNIEIENLNDILLQTARYVGQMRELLSGIGVVIKTDPTNGQPVMVFVA